jgi:hypothetical protein
MDARGHIEKCNYNTVAVIIGSPIWQSAPYVPATAVALQFTLDGIETIEDPARIGQQMLIFELRRKVRNRSPDVRFDQIEQVMYRRRKAPDAEP